MSDDLPANVKDALVNSHRTDDGNARRIVACYGVQIRYDALDETWLIWDGTRWKLDQRLHIMGLAKKTARRTLRLAVDLPASHADRDDLIEFALKSESRRSLENMIALARDYVAVTPDALDSDPWALNLKNGTLDLRTGQLREHRRDDLITKLAPVVYDPSADCPRWLAFLKLVTAGNEGQAAYLQRAVGYSLTGQTGEQVVHLLHGPGENGKTTWDKVIRSLLGDYALSVAMETFTETAKGSGPRSDLVRLRGARYISAGEPKRRVTLNEPLIKILTGGDEVVTREMYGKTFSYTPQFKVFLSVNHRPNVEGNEHAIKRRIREVSFPVKISDVTERIDDYADVLFAEEASGILNWALAGTQAWRREKLGFPPAIQASTSAYWAEVDTVERFLREECIQGPSEEEAASMLYTEYVQWAEGLGLRAVGKNDFGGRLSQAGFKSARGYDEHGDRRRIWLGLRLRDEQDGRDAGFQESPHVGPTRGIPESACPVRPVCPTPTGASLPELGG